MPRARKASLSSSAPSSPSSPSGSDVAMVEQVISKVAAGTVSKKVAELPMISSLFSTGVEMERAIGLLSAGHAIKDAASLLKDGDPNATPDNPVGKGSDWIRDEVIGITTGCDVVGFRYGAIGVTVTLKEGRSGLNFETFLTKLVESGVDLNVVEAAKKAAETRGDPFYEVKYVK